MANEFPDGWAQMEIEAKWDTTEAIFNDIVAAFSHGLIKYGYRLNVRWDGVPRRYTDIYYDNPSSDLFNAMHVIRHRQRHRTSSAIEICDSFSDLAGAAWSTLNWEKVQYKSTPTRLAAVWFRTEQGDAELTAAQVTETLAGNAPTPPYTADDNPVDLLLSDHAGFNFSQLTDVLNVSQYRHRVEFLDQDSGDALYELSLDKIVTTRSGSAAVESYGVELEALRDGTHSQSRIDQLLALMLLLEDEFELVRATRSKGDIEVDDTALPEMRIEQTTLDYGSVELGFSYSKAIVVYNDGYAPLNVTVTNQSVGQPGETQWVKTEYTDPIAVPVGTVPLSVIEIFKPNDDNGYSMEFMVSGDDPDYVEQTVTLIGEGVLPTPIDTVLVLDRSGSMSESAGSRDKIDAMRDAADLYAHLLRPETEYGPADKIGLVKYNANNSIYLDLELVDDPEVSGSHMENLESGLSDEALEDIDRLKPSGHTGIGGAMITGAGMFSGPSDERRQVMIVLTDGKENRDPSIAEALGTITTENTSLAIYSVGVGDDVEEDKLQAITNAANGDHHVSGDLSGLAIFELEMFYFKIFAASADMDLVVDPTVAVPLGGKQPIVVQRAHITSSDRSATFIALDHPLLRGYYNLELIAPNNQVMGPGAVTGGAAVHYLQRHTYTIYKVILPDSSTNGEYLGNWVLQLTPKGAEIRDAMSTLSKECNIFGIADMGSGNLLAPVGFAAAVTTDYRMETQVTTSSYAPGSNVELTAILTDKGWPSNNGKVQVDVTAPDGTIVRTIQLDKTGEGVWTGVYTLTQTPGSYRFVFRSRGRNEFGEVVPRESYRVVTLSPPKQDLSVPPPARPEGPLLWILLLILAILLFGILWLVFFLR